MANAACGASVALSPKARKTATSRKYLQPPIVATRTILIIKHGGLLTSGPSSRPHTGFANNSDQMSNTYIKVIAERLRPGRQSRRGRIINADCGGRTVNHILHPMKHGVRCGNERRATGEYPPLICAPSIGSLCAS